jgi:hypothetical protein
MLRRNCLSGRQKNLSNEKHWEPGLLKVLEKNVALRAFATLREPSDVNASESRAETQRRRDGKKAETTVSTSPRLRVKPLKIKKTA